uniref:AT20781p n=1 Tax=Drosophila melanogaster TaxID=7227 RepID=Q8T427_DROME|nr:AT20781p [Drosophila melanogaster]
MPACLRSLSPRCFQQLLRPLGRHLGSYSKAVVIAAAVRTPSAPFRAEEQRLAGLVVDELVKRTSVPREEYNKLIVCSSLKTPAPECRERLSSVAQELGLKCETLALQDDVCSISGLQMTLDCLERGEDQCIITGDTRCQVVQPEHGVLSNELMTVQQPQTRKRAGTELTTETELTPTLGAAALAWTTMQTAQRLNLQPLALLREFAVEQDHEQAMFRLDGREPVTPSDIYTWNMVTGTQKGIPESILGDLHANRLCTHDFKQITASHLLTHLVHSLPAGGLGCAFMGTTDGRSMAMVLEKLVPSIDQVEGLPLLTLYTREPCPLCDDLVEQLEQGFAGQYRLEKVYIDRKENVRFLRLFRHDIPVLFFNGQFLCMHRLNEEALGERLEALN